MKKHSEIKSKLYEALLERIDAQIETLDNAVKSVHESKANETKSSAGDKFETGRAMLHLEQDKLELQLNNTYKSKNKLAALKSIVPSENIGVGNLVYTNKGTYYISIGIGKLILEGTTYFIISADSPIGKLLVGKSKGDSVSFNGNKIEIVEVG